MHALVGRIKEVIPELNLQIAERMISERESVLQWIEQVIADPTKDSWQTPIGLAHQIQEKAKFIAEIEDLLVPRHFDQARIQFNDRVNVLLLRSHQILILDNLSDQIELAFKKARQARQQQIEQDRQAQARLLEKHLAQELARQNFENEQAKADFAARMLLVRQKKREEGYRRDKFGRKGIRNLDSK